MSDRSDGSAAPVRQSGRRRSVALAVLILCAGAASPRANGRGWQEGQGRDPQRTQQRLEEARGREGAALVALADAAMAGRVASDFAVEWRNDFFKAQTGTFVPFTVTIDRSKVSAASALMYVRAARRGAAFTGRPSADVRYPFDLIFPVDLGAATSGLVHITRGFAVPPGDYDVYVALRERAPDPLGPERRLKAAILKQPLAVPDFWEGGLATSSVMLADRIDQVSGAPAAEDVLERPYIVGENEIHVSEGSSFRKDRELIVVFLIYNATVTADKDFDIQVDYDLFRRVTTPPGGEVDASASPAETTGARQQARAGERYLTHTDPQRFKPSLMGARFDAEAGTPVMAGQGILLSSFQEGEYRLGITVTDLLSRRTLSRDVTFRVVGS
jgi:hypothetical protein